MKQYGLQIQNKSKHCSFAFSRRSYGDVSRCCRCLAGPYRTEFWSLMLAFALRAERVVVYGPRSGRM